MNIKERICENCKNIYVPSGNTQKYCKKCSILRDKERKKKWYIKKYPNAYKEKKQEVCIVCNEKMSSHFNGKPYCNKHYLKMKFYGTTESVRKSKNTYKIIDNYVKMYTTKNIEFLIDKEDLEKVLKYTWCLSKTGYLVANINKKVTKLHRYLLNAEKGTIIDHKNRNRLDNRKHNLRFCNKKENARNTSISKSNMLNELGISKTANGKYRARIMVDKKEVFLGSFYDIEKAKKARKEAELKYFEDYAPSKN